MKHSKRCQIEDFINIVVSDGERKKELVPIELLFCDKPAKHSVVFRAPVMHEHNKVVIRLCDYHFNKNRESRDNGEGNELNTPFIKYRKNRL